MKNNICYLTDFFYKKASEKIDTDLSFEAEEIYPLLNKMGCKSISDAEKYLKNKIIPLIKEIDYISLLPKKIHPEH
jgi:hypothetical protein